MFLEEFRIQFSNYCFSGNTRTWPNQIQFFKENQGQGNWYVYFNVI